MGRIIMKKCIVFIGTFIVCLLATAVISYMMASLKLNTNDLAVIYAEIPNYLDIPFALTVLGISLLMSWWSAATVE